MIWPLHDTAPLLLTPINFLLLTASTMLIAAAGYIINDYFDIRIDAINKPDAVILEKTIPRRMAIIVHSCMNVLALLLAGIVAWQAGHLEWLLLQLACTGMLWRYSTHWKRQFMIGNVVVALMTALTIITLIIYEPVVVRGFAALSVLGTRQAMVSPRIILIAFAAFAFLLTWMREIVKDMEDYKGDAAEGCNTMPIRWGLLRSIHFVQLLGCLTISLLILVSIGLLIINHGWSGCALFLLFVLTPRVLLLMLQLPKATTREQYHKASTAIKWLMVLGVWLFFLFNLFSYA